VQASRELEKRAEALRKKVQANRTRAMLRAWLRQTYKANDSRWHAAWNLGTLKISMEVSPSTFNAGACYATMRIDFAILEIVLLAS